VTVVFNRFPFVPLGIPVKTAAPPRTPKTASAAALTYDAILPFSPSPLVQEGSFSMGSSAAGRPLYPKV
jgi:hypothetical protein